MGPIENSMVLAGLFSLIIPAGLMGQVAFDTTLVFPGGTTKVLAVGDLNNDGEDDVVIATGFGDNPGQAYRISIYFAGPEGLDPNPDIYAYPALFPGVSTIAVGDVDNDGLNDIVIGLQDQIGIFHQSNDHDFGSVEMVYSGNTVDGVAIGDVNNDGLNDIVVSHWNEQTIKVFQQVAGGFTTASYPKPQGGYDQIKIGDVNGDGLNDVVLMTGQLQASGLHVYVQGLSGVLETYSSYQSSTTGIGGWMNGFAIGDLNGDGLNDLVATEGGNQPNARISIWYQDPVTHVFPGCIIVDTYQVPVGVEVADLDCDGLPEIIIGHGGWQSFSVLSQANGQYGPYEVFHFPAYGPNDPQGLGIADINGDGRKDVLTANWGFGLGCSLNATMPNEFASIVPFVTIEVIGADTVLLAMDSLVHHIDSIGNALVFTSLIYSIIDAVRRDTVQTDSAWVRSGLICGYQYVDTLHHVTTEIHDSLLWTDSLPPVLIQSD